MITPSLSSSHAARPRADRIGKGVAGPLHEPAAWVMAARRWAWQWLLARGPWLGAGAAGAEGVPRPCRRGRPRYDAKRRETGGARLDGRRQRHACHAPHHREALSSGNRRARPGNHPLITLPSAVSMGRSWPAACCGPTRRDAAICTTGSAHGIAAGGGPKEGPAVVVTGRSGGGLHGCLTAGRRCWLQGHGVENVHGLRRPGSVVVVQAGWRERLACRRGS